MPGLRSQKLFEMLQEALPPLDRLLAPWGEPSVPPFGLGPRCDLNDDSLRPVPLQVSVSSFGRLGPSSIYGGGPFLSTGFCPAGRTGDVSPAQTQSLFSAESADVSIALASSLT